MSKPKVTLRSEKNKDLEQAIVLLYSRGKEVPFRFSIGRSINSKHWNNGSGHSPVKTSYHDHAELNRFIGGLMRDLDDIVELYQRKYRQFPPTEYVRTEWERHQNPHARTFEGLYSLYQKRTAKKTGEAIKESTERSTKVLLDKLKAFSESKNVALSFENIDFAFVGEFNDWLQNTNKQSPNTRGLLFRWLKAFLRWVQEYHDIQIDRKVFRAIPTIKERKWKPSFDMNEIILLARLDLKFNPKWEITRDICIVEFNTGARIQDVLRSLLNGKSIIQENGECYFRYTTQKTKTLVSVQLFPFTIDIIKRLQKAEGNWFLFPSMLNAMIKEICAYAGINELVTVKRVNPKTGVYEELQIPKSQAISTHTFRISLINVLLERGETISTISGITGQSHATILGYMHKSKKAVTKALTGINEDLSRGVMKLVG